MGNEAHLLVQEQGRLPPQFKWSKWSKVALSSLNLSQSIMLTTPFTLAVYMVRDFMTQTNGGAELDEQAAGIRTGALAAAYSFAQCSTSLLLAYASNRVGRKPIIIMGHTACFVGMLWFGLSGSYVEAILSRVFAGLLNGILGAWKCMIGETADSFLQGQLFGYMSLAWGLGAISGPVIGGVFSHPCDRFKKMPLCAPHQLLAARPYFVPCLISGLFVLLSLVLTIFVLEETLPALVNKQARQTVAQAKDTAAARPGSKRTRSDADHASQQYEDQQAQQLLQNGQLVDVECALQTVGLAHTTPAAHGNATEASSNSLRRQQLSESGWGSFQAAASISEPQTSAMATAVLDAAGTTSTAAHAQLPHTRGSVVAAAPALEKTDFEAMPSIPAPASSCCATASVHTMSVDGDSRDGSSGTHSRRSSHEVGGHTPDGVSPSPHILRTSTSTALQEPASEDIFAKVHLSAAWASAAAALQPGGQHEDTQHRPTVAAPTPGEADTVHLLGGTTSSIACAFVHGPPLMPGAAIASRLRRLRSLALRPFRASIGGSRSMDSNDRSKAMGNESAAQQALGSDDRGVTAAVQSVQMVSSSSSSSSVLPIDCQKRGVPTVMAEQLSYQPKQLASNSRACAEPGAALSIEGKHLHDITPQGSRDDAHQLGSMQKSSGQTPAAIQSTSATVHSELHMTWWHHFMQSGVAARKHRISGTIGRERQYLYGCDVELWESQGLLQCEGSPQQNMVHCRVGNEQCSSIHIQVGHAAASTVQQDDSRIDDNDNRRAKEHTTFISDSHSSSPYCSSSTDLMPATAVGDVSRSTSTQHKEVSPFKDPVVVRSIAGYGLCCLLFCAFDELLPLFAAAPIAQGGLGLQVSALAGPLSFNGAVLMSYSVLGLPPLQRRFGTLALARAGLVVSILAAVLVPLTATALSRPRLSTAVFYISMAVKALGQSSAFTGALILVNAAPAPHQLGTVNGVGQTVASFVRGVGPAGAGIMWGWCVAVKANGQQFLPFMAVAVTCCVAFVLYGRIRLRKVV